MTSLAPFHNDLKTDYYIEFPNGTEDSSNEALGVAFFPAHGKYSYVFYKKPEGNNPYEVITQRCFFSLLHDREKLSPYQRLPYRHTFNELKEERFSTHNSSSLDALQLLTHFFLEAQPQRQPTLAIEPPHTVQNKSTQPKNFKDVWHAHGATLKDKRTSQKQKLVILSLLIKNSKRISLHSLASSANGSLLILLKSSSSSSI